MTINPAFAALALVHETLTTPDSEDWLVLFAGRDVHMVALREQRLSDGRPHVTAVRADTTVADFRRAVRALPDGHDLGCVSVIVPGDADIGGLLRWLHKMARQKGFSMTTMHGAETTASALAAFNARFNSGYWH